MLEKKFSELYEKELINPKIYPGALIVGKVIDINDKFVVVSAFLKADGFIPINQFRDENGKLEVNIGSEVEIVIDYLEDIYGDIRLSREKAKKIRAWEELEKVYKSNEVIVGYVTAKVKGGFTVKVDSIKAFLPGSLVNFKSVFDSEDIKGKELKFKIIKLEKKKNNIVVSQKFIMEERNGKVLKELLKKINEGDIINGTVKNITDYGVFIDLGGLDGLLHITDMSWKRVKHPSSLVKIGDNIKVKVLKFDKDANRVSLGLKQLSEDPWKNVKQRYKEGTHVNGRVTNITDYGCFVEIEEGIEGLVHLSEMDWTNKNINPNKIVKQEMEVKVSVLDINEDRRRISLGLKQCTDNPWDFFSKKYKVGDKIKGKIKSITDFGIFLGLSGGIDGLIHLSDITWENLNDNVLREYKKGEEIDAIILGIDVTRERISLGIKQLTEDPFLEYVNKYNKSSIVTCTFVKKLEKGIIVKLADKVEGYLKLIENNNKPLSTSVYNKDSSIKAKIVNIDKKNRNIILIAKTPLQDRKDNNINKSNFSSNKNLKLTLGDLLKKQM